ncbi:recQ-mediated genome instability protein 2-like [Oculina patagonica]
MSQKQPFSLDAPARKFFACQLPHCTSSDADQWLYHNDRVKIHFSQVWVQGIVVLVSADGNGLFLDDGTGIIEANGVTKVVKDLFIQKGMYVMVAGQLRSTGSPDQTQCPSIKVLKIADLSNYPHSEAMWMMEVIDIQSQT